MTRVLLSKMFAGSYNENSIGHEVINFYKPDNVEDSYIYNPAYGKGQDVDVVVLVGVPQKYAYPVFAVALNVEKFSQKESVSLANKISYGGKLLKDIDFDQNLLLTKPKDENYVTYKVLKGNLKQLPNRYSDGYIKQTYIIPAVNDKFTKEMQKKRIKELKAQSCKVIVLDAGNPQHSCAYVNCDNTQNKDLNDFIISAESFKPYDLKKVNLATQKISIDSNSTLNFIGKEYSEQVFTNMFFNVLSNEDEVYRKSFVEFLLKETNKSYSNSSSDFNVAKEKTTSNTLRKGRLDLLLYNKDYIIIVENKISSLLNGLYVENGVSYSQLDTYKNFAETLKTKNEELKNAKILTFLFVPEYSKVEAVGCFKISYKCLYEYFKNHKTKNLKQNLYEEFVNGLAIHSLTKEEDVNRRFLNVLNN